MRINGEETDILRSYRSNDAEGRLAIMLNNYAVFPKIIRKAEKKIQYKIKSEKEYLRSQAFLSADSCQPSVYGKCLVRGKLSLSLQHRYRQPADPCTDNQTSIMRQLHLHWLQQGDNVPR